MRRAESLPGLRKTRKVAAVLWCVQVDAAAKVGAEVDGGGGAPRMATRGRRSRRAWRGKRNDPLVLFIRQGTCVRRENQETVGLETKAVASIVADLLNKKGIMDKFLYSR